MGKFGASLGKFWVSFGQFLDKFGASFRQVSDKIYAGVGQVLGNFVGKFHASLETCVKLAPNLPKCSYTKGVIFHVFDIN